MWVLWRRQVCRVYKVYIRANLWYFHMLYFHTFHTFMLQLIWCPHLPWCIYNNRLSDRHRGSAQFTTVQFSPIPNSLYWVFSLPASSCPCLALMCIPIAGHHGKVLLWMGHLTRFIMYVPTLSNLAPLHHWKILRLCSLTHAISLITRDFIAGTTNQFSCMTLRQGTMVCTDSLCHHGVYRCRGISNSTETEMSLGWLPQSSLGTTLKLVFKVSNDDQGSRPDDLSVSVKLSVTTILVQLSSEQPIGFFVISEWLIFMPIDWWRR